MKYHVIEGFHKARIEDAALKVKEAIHKIDRHDDTMSLPELLGVLSARAEHLLWWLTLAGITGKEPHGDLHKVKIIVEGGVVVDEEYDRDAVELVVIDLDVGEEEQ